MELFIPVVLMAASSAPLYLQTISHEHLSDELSVGTGKNRQLLEIAHCSGAIMWS